MDWYPTPLQKKKEKKFNHEVSPAKLHAHSIDKNFVKVFQTYLFDRYETLKKNTDISTHGTKSHIAYHRLQFIVLSPLLSK